MVKTSVKEVKLTGGRRLVTRNIGGKVKINFLHSPEGVKVVSDSAAKTLKMERKKSKKVKIQGASKYSPAIDRILKDPKHKKILERQKRERDITDLAPPYRVNLQQRKVLEHVLGSSNEQQIERLNALIHSGVINSECPPTGRPELTEKYTDIVSGMAQCKAPSKPRVALDDKSCPGEDILAKERYVDSEGKTHCRRPVVRGEFQCPPSNNAAAKYHATLSDGTGVCLTTPANELTIEDLEISRNVFDHLIDVYPDSVQQKLKGLYDLYDTKTFSQEEISRLNKIFKTNMKRKTALYDLLHDAKLKNKIDWGKILISDDDIRIANYALLQFIHTKFPEMLSKTSPVKADKLRILGVVKKGGKKGGKKSSSKKVKKVKKVKSSSKKVKSSSKKVKKPKKKVSKKKV